MKAVSQFYRIKKVINQGKIKVHWWVQGEVGLARWERLFYRDQMLSDGSLSFWGMEWCQVGEIGPRADLISFEVHCVVLMQRKFENHVFSALPSEKRAGHVF